MGIESINNRSPELSVSQEERDIGRILNSENPVDEIKRFAGHVGRGIIKEEEQRSMLVDVLDPEKRGEALSMLTWACLPQISQSLKGHESLIPQDELVGKAMLITLETIVDAANNPPKRGVKTIVKLKLDREIKKLGEEIDRDSTIQTPQLDHRISNPEDYDNVDIVSSVTKAVDSLSERERKIIQLRYGLAGEPQLKLDSIGERFGVTGTRVGVQQRQAESRMRLPSIGLKEYLGANDKSIYERETNIPHGGLSYEAKKKRIIVDEWKRRNAVEFKEKWQKSQEDRE